MSDMLRTVIINGDPGWRFRSLLWSHGLDLFRVETAVQLRDCTPPNEDEREIIGALGSFPEEFPKDPVGLAEQSVRDVKWLLEDDRRILATAAVVSLASLTDFVASGDSWKDEDLAEHHGLCALGAIRAAIDALDRQAETANEFSSAKTRLWLSIIVRDAGHSRADDLTVRKALELLSSRNVIVRNAYLLSNGAEQNTSKVEMLAHFAKLRLLIDAFGSESQDDAGWKTLRRSDGGAAGSPVEHMVLDPRSYYQQNFGAVLRGELVRRLQEAGDLGDSARVSQTSISLADFKADAEAKLPFLAQEPYGRERAESELTEALSRGVADPTEKEGIREVRLDQTDVDAVLSKLRTVKRRWFDLQSERRRDRMRNTATEFEVAINSTRARYGGVIGHLVVQDQSKLLNSRYELLASLENLELPRGKEGQREKDAYVAQLKDLKEKTKAEIEKSVAISKVSVENEERGAAERQSVLDLLDLKEQQLFAAKAFRTPLVFLLIMSLPIMVYYGYLVIWGPAAMTSFRDVMDAAGPLFFVALSAAVLSLMAGLLMGRRSTVARNRVLDDLISRLQSDYSRLRSQHFAKLTVAHNRRRLADISLILQKLQPSIMRREAEQIRALSDYLSTEQSYPEVALGPVDPNTVTSLTEAAVESFNKETGPRAKVAGFLSARTAPKPSVATFKGRGKNDPHYQIKTTATLGQIEAVLKEPGRV